MRNVEIKAKIRDYENICKIAEEISDGASTLIKQDDTFYNVNEGRLKMRFYADEAATLVQYDRKDEGGPKLCDYELLQFTPDEAGKAKLLDDMLKKCLGIRGRVVKE
ncbi:Adenylate cyclase, partial [Operophtera brumata]